MRNNAQQIGPKALGILRPGDGPVRVRRSKPTAAKMPQPQFPLRFGAAHDPEKLLRDIFPEAHASNV